MSNHEYAFLLNNEEEEQEKIHKLVGRVAKKLNTLTQPIRETMDVSEVLSFTDMMRGMAQEELRKLDSDAGERWRVTVLVSPGDWGERWVLSLVAKERKVEEIKKYAEHLARKERLSRMVTEARTLQMPHTEG